MTFIGHWEAYFHTIKVKGDSDRTTTVDDSIKKNICTIKRINKTIE